MFTLRLIAPPLSLAGDAGWGGLISIAHSIVWGTGSKDVIPTTEKSMPRNCTLSTSFHFDLAEAFTILALKSLSYYELRTLSKLGR